MPCPIRRQKILHAFHGYEFGVRPRASVIDQIPSHGPSSYSEEMLPILPISIFGRHQADIDLVHKVGCLQAVVGTLAPHQVSGQAPQVGQHKLK